MPALTLRLYVGLVAFLAALALAVLAVVAGGDVAERAWLGVLLASVIALEHLFEIRLVREGEQGESTTHE